MKERFDRLCASDSGLSEFGNRYFPAADPFGKGSGVIATYRVVAETVSGLRGAHGQTLLESDSTTLLHLKT